jgi:hypothetical protein
MRPKRWLLAVAGVPAVLTLLQSVFVAVSEVQDVAGTLTEKKGIFHTPHYDGDGADWIHHPTRDSSNLNASIRIDHCSSIGTLVHNEADDDAVNSSYDINDDVTSSIDWWEPWVGRIAKPFLTVVRNNHTARWCVP